MHTTGDPTPGLADTQKAESTGSESGDSTRGAYERPMRSRETRRYRVMSEHARGGLGRILCAEDTRLGRTVAIKELLQSSKLAEALFIREALITARLQHPGIVPVHEAGRWPKGDPFYVMKLVAGKSLQQLIREHRSLGERMALLSNVIAVVETIAYAHSQGVIHRDIKPANILIGEFGETVVVDWGLARDNAGSAAEPVPAIEECANGELGALGATGEPPGSVWLISGNYSISGKIIGTPAYMAPEQARGELVDERADVYALGALLYELMSGNPPYPGRELPVVLEQVLSGPPKPLSELDPAIPQELITIIEKAMAREPALRYPSARELAADLKRFHTGKLVSAHKYTASQLIRRWLWRHRSPIAVACAALLVLAVTGVMSVHRIIQERNIAHAERNTAKAERTVARQAKEQAEERERELLLLQAKSALERDPTAALAWLKRARLDDPYFDRARAIYDAAMVAGVARHITTHTSWVLDAAFAPDSKTVFSAARDGTIKATDVATGAVRLALRTAGNIGLSSVAVSPDGNWLAAGRVDSVVELAPLGQRHKEEDNASRQLGPASTESAHVVKFSRDSRYVLTVLNQFGLRVFEVASGRMLIDMEQARAAEFASSAGQLFVGEGGNRNPRLEGALLVMDLAGRREIRRISLPAPARVIRESPRGGLIAMHLDNSELVLVDLTTAPVSVRSLGMANLAVARPETPLAFSPSGQYLATTGSGYEVLVWDMATLKARAFQGHENEILDLNFTPDNRLLVSTSDDGTVRVWDLASDDAKVLRGHRDDVWIGVFSPDGAWLATSSLDLTMRLWSMADQTSRMRLSGHTRDPRHVAFAGKERLITVTGDRHHEIYAWNTQTGQHEELRRHQEGDSLYDTPFLHHGRHVLISNRPAGTLEVWDLTSGSHQTFTPPVQPDTHDLLAAAPPLIALRERKSGATRVLPLGSDRVIELGLTQACSAIFSPDGNELVTGGQDGIKLWDLKASGTMRIIDEVPMTCDVRPWTMWKFSPDGAWLAFSPSMLKLRIWSRETGAVRNIDLRGHHLSAMAFSPTSSQLAMSVADRRVSMLDLATGKERNLGQHADIVWIIRWSPDGRTFATASYDHTIRLWDPVSGSHRALLGHSHSIDSIAFSPDGQQLASVSRDRTVRVWDVSADPIADADALRTLIEAGSSAELSEDNDRVRTAEPSKGG